MALGCLLSGTLYSSAPTAPTAPTQHSADCCPPGLRPVYFKTHLGDPVSLLCPPGPGQLSPECSVLKESPTRYGGLVLLRARTWEPSFLAGFPAVMVDRASDQVCVFLSLLGNIKHRNSGAANTWVETLPRSFSILHSRASVCCVGTEARTPKETKIHRRSNP